MFGLGAGELFLILVLALIFIGPKKLPEMAKGLGKGIKEFNKAKNEIMDKINEPEVSSEAMGQTPKSTISESKILKQEESKVAESGSVSLSTEQYKASLSDAKSGDELKTNLDQKTSESNS